MRNFSVNKKINFEYFVIDRLEAGIVLHGDEVKSIRLGRCSIKEAYIKIINGECIIIGMNISPYEMRSFNKEEPVRDRKLLLHKNQISKLQKQLDIKGYTIVPTRVYESKGKVKVEIALAKGKHNYDKRESIKEKDIKRELERKYKV